MIYEGHWHVQNEPTGLRAALILFAANGALFGIWIVRVPDIKLALALSEAQLGLVLLAAAAGAVTTFGLSARAADRWGAGRVSLFFAVAMAVSLPILSIMPSAGALAALLFVFGAAGGSMDLTMNAYATEVERRAKRSRMALLHGCWSVGMASSAAIAFLGAARLPVQVHFTAGAVLGLLAIGISGWLIISPGRQSGGSGKQSALIALPRGPQIPIAIITAIAFMTEGAGMEWGGVYIRETLGGTIEQGALALLVLSSSVMAIRLIGDPIIERIGAGRTVQISAGFVIAGTLLAGLSGNATPALIGMGLLGAGLALMAPICFSRAGQLAESGSGEAVAAVSMTGYGGILLGPVLMGLSGEAFGLDTSFALLAVGGVALALMARRVG
ncbi:Predicted arabinose efflux permease, MFS family [Monaibacterium marinum]|uniref:Predicted arabinose efflux permease, MFS family n=1 Tax=Pontivivens marinum TaxID=1690039 RepID=A0A2C9CQN5_9RHOB|nr:Predicted arabinose efflux permease, MFS family [Monaibacterium marinum]